MSDSDLRVAIIGGGIGGLSLGLALRERGLRADVFEQAPELAEIGAAIALSANSIREFERLGLEDALAADSAIPTELIYRHWQDGSRIAAHPVGEDNRYQKRFGGQYSGIHRADLQKTLGGAFSPQHEHLGCRLVNIVQERVSVVLEFANGRVYRYTGPRIREHYDGLISAKSVGQYFSQHVRNCSKTKCVPVTE